MTVITQLRMEDFKKCPNMEYVEKALKALNEGKAFCPSCNWAGLSNCGYFDECGGGIFPSDYVSSSDGKTDKTCEAENTGTETNSSLDS